MSDTAAASPARERRAPLAWHRLAVPAVFIAVVVFFALTTPTFLTVANLTSLLLNNFTLLAIVSTGMTIAVAAGGIDLSVGTALDFSSLAFIVLLNSGFGFATASAGALAAGAAAGAFNAVLIGGLRLTPFLATLGTLFVGTSVQQLLSGGGLPIYLIPGVHIGLASAKLGGIPVPLLIVAGVAAVYGLVLARGRFGRALIAVGEQPAVAYYSGLRARRVSGLTYIACALAAAVAGIVLSSTVSAYVPLSGNAFMLNAIGATFIGTTLSRTGRPNIVGTLLGVLFLNVVANGLLLIGWNFYWQQVSTGVLIFAILAFSFVSSSRT
ncbi:ABC transporter permease [Pararobbsia silviterrae]|nr:ABC transporter permease [Pararobbsia silviterrae]